MNKINLQKQADDIGIELKNLLSLYSLFIEQTEGDIAEMERQISKRDLKSMRASAHHIKGASLNLEIYSLVESAKSLETLSDDKDRDRIAAEFENFKEQFIELKSYILQVEHE